MQKRLITFGCSFTYGQGLPDCLTNEDAPSQYAWPVLLSKKLDRELINASSPGSSNLEILYQLLNFKFKKDDLIVVMWTVYDRDVAFYKKLFSSKTVLEKVGAWCRHGFGKKVLQRLDLHDQATKSWIYIHHADLFLKSKKVKYIHYTAIAGHLAPYQPKFITIDNMHDNGVYWIDRTDDNHPGIESNKLTANNIYEIATCKID
jgi:hypothetical protein